MSIQAHNTDLYVTPLSGDYRNPDRLTEMFGVERLLWPIGSLKEVVEDLVDSAEEAGLSPHVRVTWSSTSFTIIGNGSHLPFTTLQSVLDYTSAATTRGFRAEPCRGRTGRGLKVSLATCAFDGGWTEIETKQYHVRVDVVATQDGGTEGTCVQIEQPHSSFEGTRFTFHWPGTNAQGPMGLGQHAVDLLCRYLLVMPHAKFEFTHQSPDASMVGGPADPTWKGWRPGEPVDPNWHTDETFIGMVNAEIDSGRADMTVDMFLQKRFAGFARKGARNRVLADMAEGTRLRDLTGIDGHADSVRCGRLLRAMSFVRPIPAKRFGILGDAFVAARLRALFDCRTDAKAVRYAARSSDKLKPRPAVPFIVEGGLGLRKPAAEGKLPDERSVIVSVNGGVTLWDKDGVDVLDNMLQAAHVNAADPVVFWLRVVTPGAKFGAPSKSMLLTETDTPLLAAISEVVHEVTKGWTAATGNRGKDGLVKPEQIARFLGQDGLKKGDLGEWMREAIPHAYRKSAGKFSFAFKRGIWYVVVSYVYAHHGFMIGPKSYGYFAYTVLPAFLTDHEELVQREGWVVLSAMRGDYTKPYTHERVPMATADVMADIETWTEEVLEEVDVDDLFAGQDLRSVQGPALRENGLLLVEKAERKDLLEMAAVGERYGLRIATCSGSPVTAVRIIAQAQAKLHRPLPVYFVHDLDTPGLYMLRYLIEDARFHKYDKGCRPKIVNLGLRYDDAKRIIALREERDGLPHDVGEMQDESTARQSLDEITDLVDDKEMAILRKHLRIELDSLTNEEFIDDFVCPKLDGLEVKRIQLSGDALRRVTRRALRIAILREACRRLLREPVRQKLPPDLAERVAQEMAADALISCDQAAFRVAERLVANKRERGAR